MSQYPVDPELTECSGLVASLQHPGVLWAHNDSGHEPILYAIEAHSGRTLGKLAVDGPAVDWEDIAISGTTIYVGDTGTNVRLRWSVYLVSIEEPTEISAAMGPVKGLLVELRWPDRIRDAEGLVVDPTGAVAILFAGRDVFYAPIRFGVRNLLEPLALGVMPATVRGADWSFTNAIALRFPDYIVLAESGVGVRRVWPPRTEVRGESVAIGLSQDLYSIPEGVGALLTRYARN